MALHAPILDPPESGWLFRSQQRTLGALMGICPQPQLKSAKSCLHEALI